MYYKSFLYVPFNYYGNNCVCHFISYYVFYSIHHLLWCLLDINVTMALISRNVSERLRCEYLDEQMKVPFEDTTLYFYVYEWSDIGHTSKRNEQNKDKCGQTVQIGLPFN